MDRRMGDDLALDTVWIDPVQCTPLLGVDPIGRNTLVVESLLSWFIRLAREHAVSPRALLKDAIGQYVPGIASLCYASFYRRHAATVNGLGRYAALFAGALAELSGTTGLRQHTLLPWRPVLATQGSPLISPTQRWCPHCLADMIDSGVDPYRPLLWSVRIVEICPLHKLALQRLCPHCGVLQPVIPRWPDIVYCDTCRRSLHWRESVAPRGQCSESVTNDRLWYAHAVADLLRCGSTLGGNNAIERLMFFLDKVVQSIASGNRAEICRQTGFPTRALNKWMIGKNRPSLSSLLRLLRALECWPSEAFLGGPQIDVPRRVMVPRAPDARRIRRRHSAKDVQMLEREAQSDDPPPLATLARRMGITRSGLKYRYPDECRAIVDARRKQRDIRTARTRGDQMVAVTRIVKRICQKGEIPGRKRVESVARRKGFSLLTPDLRRVFQQSLIDYLKT